jgi:hypothetical protein
MSYDISYKVSNGIILSSLTPTKRTTTILDSVRGKVNCFLHRSEQSLKLAHGTLIECVLDEKKDLLIASFIEPIGVPADWVCQDIYFLHHVLELCATYIPLNQAAQETFSLLSLLYRPCSLSLSFFKKVFLCKLHISLGMHPDEEVYDPMLLSLISCAGDSMFDFQDDTELESKLAMWLYRSLHAANAHKCLKTFSFVKRLDIYYEDT